MDESHTRLKLARERAGYLNGTDAARAFGWVPSTYLGHENGSRGINVAAARGYAKAFGVSIAWLLGEGEKIAANPFLIPVIGSLEPEAYRKPGYRPPGTPGGLLMEVFGYQTEELEAFHVYDYSSHRFVFIARNGTEALLREDAIVIQRTEGNLIETAAWFVIKENGESFLKPAFAPWISMDPLPIEILNGPDARVIGVVVGELRVLTRAERTDPFD